MLKTLDELKEEAAALEYAITLSHQKDVTDDELVKQYRITLITMRFEVLGKIRLRGG